MRLILVFVRRTYLHYGGREPALGSSEFVHVIMMIDATHARPSQLRRIMSVFSPASSAKSLDLVQEGCGLVEDWRFWASSLVTDYVVKRQEKRSISFRLAEVNNANPPRYDRLRDCAVTTLSLNPTTRRRIRIFRSLIFHLSYTPLRDTLSPTVRVRLLSLELRHTS